MKTLPTCPNPGCPRSEGEKTTAKDGFFYRRDDSRRIQRYKCRVCRRHFSAATSKDTYRQKKRRINPTLWWLLNMKPGMRAISRYLGINRKTVAARLDWLAQRAERRVKRELPTDVEHVHFDELQSSIVTKCKPVSIPMAVCARTRLILALDVCSMPAQHPLVAKALAKYGPRADERPEAIDRVLAAIRPVLARRAYITTDAAPRYPEPIARILAGVRHFRTLSRRATTWGQGEIKQGGFDALFSLNSTAAMVRDTVSRMVRRTWCNSKRMDRLRAHLWLNAEFHNAYIRNGLAGAR